MNRLILGALLLFILDIGCVELDEPVVIPAGDSYLESEKDEIITSRQNNALQHQDQVQSQQQQSSNQNASFTLEELNRHQTSEDLKEWLKHVKETKNKEYMDVAQKIVKLRDRYLAVNRTIEEVQQRLAQGQGNEAAEKYDIAQLQKELARLEKELEDAKRNLRGIQDTIQGKLTDEWGDEITSVHNAVKQRHADLSGEHVTHLDMTAAEKNFNALKETMQMRYNLSMAEERVRKARADWKIRAAEVKDKMDKWVFMRCNEMNKLIHDNNLLKIKLKYEYWEHNRWQKKLDMLKKAEEADVPYDEVTPHHIEGEKVKEYQDLIDLHTELKKTNELKLLDLQNLIEKKQAECPVFSHADYQKAENALKNLLSDDKPPTSHHHNHG